MVRQELCGYQLKNCKIKQKLRMFVNGLKQGEVAMPSHVTLMKLAELQGIDVVDTEASPSLSPRTRV